MGDGRDTPTDWRRAIDPVWTALAARAGVDLAACRSADALLDAVVAHGLDRERRRRRWRRALRAARARRGAGTQRCVPTDARRQTR